jgi:uncharacterized protein FYDLN
MENFICVQCGTRFFETAKPPLHCPVCEDERQFIRHSGHEWTTLKVSQPIIKAISKKKRRNSSALAESPEFAIGQRALLGKRETSNTQQTLVGRRGKPSRAEGFPISSS